MGLFDSVFIPCPHCGEKVELQCSGEESMTSYTVETAPDYILRQVVDGEPDHCRKCDGWMALVDARHPWKPPERPPTMVVKVRSPTNPITHGQGFKWWPTGQTYSVDDIIK